MRYQVLHSSYRYWWVGLIVVVVMMYAVVLLVVQFLVGSAPTHAEPVARRPAPSLPPSVVEPVEEPVEEPPAPLAAVSADLVRYTARTDRVVALTFDDGPDPEYTPQVLALLAQYRAVATFCMIGADAARHPELVRAVVAAGMRLCDHTATHDLRLVDRPESQIEAEILGGRAELLTLAGSDVTIDYFRAPGGRWSDPMRQIAARHGMKPLSWSVDPRDWSRPGVSRLVTTVQQRVQPGAVILLHDGGGQRDQTVAALAELLPWLVAQGYQFDVPGR
ncbi:MAG: polysaccharide deacetylase family protein [Pseudonocardiales bacterium]